LRTNSTRLLGTWRWRWKPAPPLHPSEPRQQPLLVDAFHLVVLFVQGNGTGLAHPQRGWGLALALALASGGTGLGPRVFMSTSTSTSTPVPFASKRGRRVALALPLGSFPVAREATGSVLPRLMWGRR
jgi:hypothetical protein